MGQSMPGALGLVWPPRAEIDELADKLVGTACDWFRRCGVKVCQAFSTADEMTLMAPFSHHGFRNTAQLITLRCAIDGEVSQEFSRVRDRISPPFTAPSCPCILSTHEGTLDCPELNLGRTPDELLAEFARWVPDTTWHLARRDELPIGIAILTTVSMTRKAKLNWRISALRRVYAVAAWAGNSEIRACGGRAAAVRAHWQ